LAAGKKVWVEKLDLKGNRREIKKKATEKAVQFFYGKIARGGRLRKQAIPKK
jgi:hypothetical protein